MRTNLIVAGLVLFSVCAGAASLEATLIQADGEEVAGELKEINAEGATVGNRKFAAREISQIKFPGVPHAAAAVSPSIVLRNKDTINRATILSATDTKLKLKHEWLGECELEFKAIDALVFYGAAKKMPEGLDALLKAPPPQEDLLLTLKGEAIQGFYEKLSDKEVTFNAGGQSRAYPVAQLAVLRLAATEKNEPNLALNAVLRLIDGTQITVKPLKLEAAAGADGFLSALAFESQTLRMALVSIVSLEFSGGRMVYLSALAPKTVEQRPYVGGAPVVFTWRKDRSAANGPLKIDETVYEKGIGVHSYCRLVYDLNGEYVKFMADVGMDASAPPKAECAWKVLADGKESAAGIAKTGGGKKGIKIDITGAKTLELICDFGPDEDDAGDRLDFGKARLVKP